MAAIVHPNAAPLNDAHKLAVRVELYRKILTTPTTAAPPPAHVIDTLEEEEELVFDHPPSKYPLPCATTTSTATAAAAHAVKPIPNRFSSVF